MIAEYLPAVVHRSAFKPPRGIEQPRVVCPPTWRRGRSEAGFTLVEMMVVVIIIAVLAVLALPSITEELRSRRTQNAAREIASLYRTARMRALSRGSAVLVRYDTALPEGSFEVREAVRNDGTNCNNMPISSCTGTTWTGPDNMLIGGFTTAGRGEYQSGGTKVVALMQLPSGATAQYDVCFSPMGNTYARSDQVTAFAPMTTVPAIRVQRNGVDGNPYGPIRVVLVLPNGNAHLGMPLVPP